MKIKTILIIITVLHYGCTNDFMTRNDPEFILANGSWKDKITQHYNIYYHPNSEVAGYIDSLSTIQESNYSRLMILLNIENSIDKINVFIFKDRDELYNKTGSNADAFTISEYNTAYCYGKGGFGSHEITHLIMTKYYGNPKEGPFNRLLREGIAYYSDEGWYNIDYYYFFFFLLKENEITTPLQIVRSYRTNKKLKYNKVEGVFCKYIIETYGFKIYLKLYQNVKNEDDFKDILGVDFEKVNADFLNFINEYNQSHSAETNTG